MNGIAQTLCKQELYVFLQVLYLNWHTSVEPPIFSAISICTRDTQLLRWQSFLNHCL